MVREFAETEPYQEPKLKTPPMVEKEMGKAAFKYNVLASYVKKEPGRPTLAPIDDPRPAWVPDDISNEFEVIEK